MSFLAEQAGARPSPGRTVALWKYSPRNCINAARFCRLKHMVEKVEEFLAKYPEEY